MRLNTGNLVLAGMFLLVLALPLLDMAANLVSDPEIDENRRLAPFPEVAADKAVMRAFPPGFEAWFADHMGLRGTLVGLYRRINQDLLDSADNVLTGSDDWLFLLRDTVDYANRLPLPADLCGRNPFTADQLAAWRRALEENRRAVEALGAKYLLMIVPNKQSIHGEHLPSRVRCHRGGRRVDQLSDELTRIPGFPLVPLESAFTAAAGDGIQLWYRTDTHWDARGAALGYRELMRAVQAALGRNLPDPLALGSVRVVPMQSPGWGLSRMLGSVRRHRERASRLEIGETSATSSGNALPEFARGRYRPSERFSQPQSDLPTVLALHDSFFDDRFKRLLAESFSRADFIWHRGVPTLDRELELIGELKPDIVVHEMVERNLLHPYFDESGRR